MIDSTYAVTAEPQTDGHHFVHRSDCQVLPQDLELKDLGTFDDCAPALDAARETFQPVNGCALCCPECHAGETSDET